MPMIRTVLILCVLALVGCTIQPPYEPEELICDEELSEIIYRCFDWARDDRESCWMDVTGQSDFEGYFLDGQKSRAPAWFECVDDFNLQLASCVDVAPNLNLPWQDDPFELCLRIPADRWGHPVRRLCSSIVKGHWNTCVSTVNINMAELFRSGMPSEEVTRGWNLGVSRCREIYVADELECLNEDDLRLEDCFIEIFEINNSLMRKDERGSICFD